MFPLNIATVIITLVGHLIFGLFLGLAFLKAPRGERSGWPWPPLSESAPVKRAIRFSKKVTNSPHRRASRGSSRNSPTTRGDMHGAFKDQGPTRWVKIAPNRRSTCLPTWKSRSRQDGS